ncbi:hypothetical protein SAMN04488557_1873 [Hyphomicrobium facile]|uniref:Uncharacterized protein n=1 Tax=Hyphomicrobium facile TaxID=51670 RepID=A0A1I7NEU3_9HYPH|nr:hypothetical protein SAMN04488557_1873 [Hyphomicrobium facile]
MCATKRFSSAGLLMGAAAAVSILGSGAFSFAAESAVMGDRTSSYGGLVVADAHPYRHCHNLLKRTYCHKADRLPQNWPPNTDTPHRSGSDADTRKDCTTGSRGCGSNSQYDKG